LTLFNFRLAKNYWCALKLLQMLQPYRQIIIVWDGLQDSSSTSSKLAVATRPHLPGGKLAPMSGPDNDPRA
jgi:hypothetical protein